MSSPIFLQDNPARAARGSAFEIHEGTGSGPAYVHVHHADDEAWHVLEGKLVFRFADGEREALPGTTVVVPAGVAHTYFDPLGNSRYLLILTPKLGRMIQELHQTPIAQHAAVMEKYDSAIVTLPRPA